MLHDNMIIIVVTSLCGSASLGLQCKLLVVAAIWCQQLSISSQQAYWLSMDGTDRWIDTSLTCRHLLLEVASIYKLLI